MKLTKRKFLSVVLGVGGAVTLRFVWRHDWAEALLPRMPRSSARGLLTPEQTAIVLAYAEALADDRDFSEETRQYFKKHLDDRTQNRAGFLTLYEMTAQFLKRLGEFEQLPREQRVALLEKHGLMGCRVHRRECFSPFGRKERMIRGLAAPDLVSAYYTSAAGWAVVGYSVFPGGCGDLHRYTKPEKMSV